MALKAYQIRSIAAYLNGLSRQRVGKVLQFSKDVFSFRFQRSGRLVLDLDNQSPCLFLTQEEENGKASLATPGSALLRKKLSGAEFIGASQVHEDRVIELRFLGVNDIFQEERFSLFVELIPTKANMALVDDNGKILFAFRPNSIGDPRPIFRGITYEPPLRKGELTGEDEGFDPVAYFASCKGVEQRIQDSRKANVYQDFFRTTNAKVKSLKRKIAQIERDIENGQKHVNDFEYGNYIFTFADQIKPGDEAFDYYGTRVPLDPLKSPADNANDFFKKAKKAKNAVALGEENKAKAEEELAHALSLLEFAKTCDEETLARLLGTPKQGKGAPKGKAKPVQGPLPYVARFGNDCVFFGRSAKQNDYLSFLYATKGDYLWFHVKDSVGAHVILPVSSPDDRLVQFACEIAVLASNKLDGEVQFTAHKNIRKGSKPGQVILGSYRSARIKAISPEAKASYEQALSQGARK